MHESSVRGAPVSVRSAVCFWEGESRLRLEACPRSRSKAKKNILHMAAGKWRDEGGRLCPDLAKVAQQFPYKTQSFPDIVTLLAFPDGVRVSVKHSTVV